MSHVEEVSWESHRGKGNTETFRLLTEKLPCFGKKVFIDVFSLLGPAGRLIAPSGGGPAFKFMTVTWASARLEGSEKSEDSLTVLTHRFTLYFVILSFLLFGG
jgi:hypothetical protein